MTSEDLKDLFATNAKKPLMGRFYENQRKSLKILVNPDDTPEGGKWSYDEMNRKKLPKKINIPDTPKLQKNKFVVNEERSLANFDIEFIGESKNFLYPTNFDEADEWLNDFFKDRFLVVNLVKENEYLNVRYQEKPFMLWIWISAIIISLGGIISIFKKNEK